MLVFVHLDDGVEPFFQGVAVSGEADYRQDNARRVVAVVAYAEELGDITRVDVVTGGGARVTGEDGEVGAGDA